MKKNRYSVGLGMAGPEHTHQDLCLYFIINYLHKFRKNNIFQATIMCDNPERIPDISIWAKVKRGKKTEPSCPLLSVEFTHSRQNDKYSDESILETFQYLPTLQEVFIYNYALDKWIRYSREDKKIVCEDGKDYSRVLKCYLHTLATLPKGYS